MLVWMSIAAADTFEVSDTGYATLALAVDAARRLGGSNLILVDSAYDGRYEDPVDVSNLILEIRGGSMLPPIRGTDVALTLTDTAFTTSASFDFSTYGALPCAVCVERGAVTLSGVELSDIGGVGVAAVDANATLSDVTAKAVWGGRSVMVVGLAASPTASISDSHFLDSSGGALKFYANNGKKVTATLSDVQIEGNSGGEGAAIYTYATELRMLGGSVAGTIGIDESEASPIHARRSQLTFDGVSFSNNYGDAASLLFSADESGTGVQFVGGSIAGSHNSGNVEFQAETLELDGVEWAPGGEAFASTWLTVRDTSIDVSAAAGLAVLRTTDGVIDVTRSRFCGSLGRGTTLVMPERGYLSVYGSQLRDLTMIGLPFFTLASLADGGAAQAYVVDNTFDTVGMPSIFSGAVGNLTFVNNLVVGGSFTNGLDAAPSGSISVGYNLYAGGVDDFDAGLGVSGTADIEAPDTDPLLARTTVDSTLCGGWTELQADSPAVDAGHPGLASLDGHSDIGARDRGGNVDDTGLDTGDTGVVDTGDTGVVDTGDTSGPGDGESGVPDGDGDGYAADVDCDDQDAGVYPGAADAPDDGVDQDCDEVDASISYAGGCGCASGGGAAGLGGVVIGGAVLARRRRRA